MQSHSENKRNILVTVDIAALLSVIQLVIAELKGIRNIPLYSCNGERSWHLSPTKEAAESVSSEK